MITLSWDIQQPVQKGSFEDIARLIIKNRAILGELVGDQFASSLYCLYGDHSNVERTYYTTSVSVDREGNIVAFGEVFEDYVYCTKHGSDYAVDGTYFWEALLVDIMESLEDLKLSQIEKDTLREMFPE